MQLNPFALRMMLHDHMIRDYAYATIPYIFETELEVNHWTMSDLIVHIYVLFARIMYLAFLR